MTHLTRPQTPRRRQRPRLYLTYILYNLCFILIPILSLVGIYRYQTEQRVTQDLLSGNEFVLRQTASMVDTYMEELNAFAYQLSSDKHISPYSLRRGNYGSIEALDKLKMYTARFGFLSDMFLYIHGEDTLYSGRGTTNFNTLFGQHRINIVNTYTLKGNWSKEGLTELLNSGTLSAAMPEGSTLVDSDGKECLLVVCPWKSPTTVRIGSVVGIIRRDTMEALLEDSGEMDRGMYIFNGSGGMIAGSQRNVSFDDEQLLSFARLYEEGVSEAEGCHLLFEKSAVNGWLYMSVIPRAALASSVFSGNDLLFSVALVLALVLTAIGIWLGYRTYQPVRSLLERVDDEELASRCGEFEAIGKYIAKIVDSNLRIMNQLEKSREHETQLLLQKIISGNTSMERLEAEKERIHLIFPFSAIAVLSTFRRIEPLEREKTLLEPLNRIEGVYATEMMYKDFVAVLINFAEENALDGLLEQIYRDARTGCGADMVIGVGRVCTGIADLRHSLTEAIIAIEYGKVDDNSYIVHYASISAIQPNNFMLYLHSLQMKLVESLRRRDEAIVEATLDRLKAAALEEWDEARVRYLVSSLIFCLMSAMQEARTPDCRKKIEALENCGHLEEFFFRASLCAGEIMASYSSQAREKQLSLYERILQYIDGNYKSSDLSLSAIAQQFDITPSYLSRFFRETNGVTFIDYLTGKRMTEARRLLLTTDEKIQTIVEQVGYLDIASFSRKFKQLYGITPGKYREQNVLSGNEADS